MKPIISLVVAESENHVIGKDNQLIWHLPNDLRHFKEKTLGKPVIMGRKTFESIGRPLPERQNIVISRDVYFSHPGILRVGSLAEAIQQAGQVSEIMIIGGGSIYEQALPIADKIYLTRVLHTFEGDVFFPAIDLNVWQLISEEKHDKDEKHAYNYVFFEYVLKES